MSADKQLVRLRVRRRCVPWVNDCGDRGGVNLSAVVWRSKRLRSFTDSAEAIRSPALCDPRADSVDGTRSPEAFSNFSDTASAVSGAFDEDCEASVGPSFDLAAERATRVANADAKETLLILSKDDRLLADNFFRLTTLLA